MAQKTYLRHIKLFLCRKKQFAPLYLAQKKQYKVIKM
jgi:hypothetical protein